MAKILILKEKKEFVPELGRKVTVVKPKVHYVTNLTKDFSTKYGTIKKADLKKKDGSKIKTHTGKEFIIFSSTFIDNYKRLRKFPQTIPLKDIGLIIAETGMDKDSVIVDAGTGSGALAASLARICKKVVTYEIREDCLAVAQENIKALGLKNVTIKKKSIYDGITEKNVDVITLDLPEPWNVIKHASKALNIGGFLVSYSPSVPSMQDFVNEIRNHDSFLVVKTVEVIERLWTVEGRRVHPKSTPIGHSGFLTFVRRIA